jgi:hypothetical protein
MQQRARTRSALVCAALLAFAGACSSRDTAAPVATIQLTSSRTTAAIGSPIDFTFRFEVAPDETIAADYKVFVHMLDADERILWTDDHDPPVPTSEWTPGQIVEYTRTRFVPSSASVGDVTILAGLYGEDGRLPLMGPDEASADGNSRAYRVGGLQLVPETENIFVIYRTGWHPEEFSEESPEGLSWMWTQRSAVLSVINPRRDATLYLEYDSRPDAFADAPQQVTVHAGDQLIERFPVDHTGPRLKRIPIPSEALGTGEMAEIRLDVDRTFTPASMPAGGKDDRELGIRVYHAFLESR